MKCYLTRYVRPSGEGFAEDIKAITLLEKEAHTYYDEDFEAIVTDTMCWDKVALEKFYAKRNMTITVYDNMGIRGFCCYETRASGYIIHKVEAHDTYILSQLVGDLKSRLTKKRNSITVFVPAGYVDRQVWFLSQDFLCTGTVPNHFGNEEAYRFDFKL